MSNEPIAYLRDLQPEAEDEALAVCWRGDPGAFPVYADPSYASSQAEIELLRDMLQSIKTYGYLANIPVDQGWGSSGKKPASKDVWCFPRHMLNDLDAALSGSKE